MDICLFPFFFLDKFLAKGTQVVGELHRILFKGGGYDIIQISFKIHDALHIG